MVFSLHLSIFIPLAGRIRENFRILFRFRGKYWDRILVHTCMKPEFEVNNKLHPDSGLNVYLKS